MPRHQDPNQQANPPADVAAPDSVGRMAPRLLHPAPPPDPARPRPPPHRAQGA